MKRGNYPLIALGAILLFVGILAPNALALGSSTTPSCLAVYGTANPAVIISSGTHLSQAGILAFAQSANPGLYWTYYGGYWYGTSSPPAAGVTNFPGAVAYPVNGNIYEWQNPSYYVAASGGDVLAPPSLYDLTLYLGGGCLVGSSAGSTSQATTTSSTATSTVAPTTTSTASEQTTATSTFVVQTTTTSQTGTGMAHLIGGGKPPSHYTVSALVPIGGALVIVGLFLPRTTPTRKKSGA